MNATRWALVACVAAILAGCAREADPPVQPPISEEVDPSLAEFEKKRLEKEERLAKLPVAELSQAVAEDSAQHVESFNSAAVREIRRRAEADPAQGDALAKKLAGSLREPDARSALGLMALRDLNPAVYQTVDANFRYQVLADALQKAEFYNAWGVPHLFLDQTASLTIICENRGIEKYLYPLLDNANPAPVFGGAEIVEEHDSYGYRVKDFAWALINRLRGTPVEIPVSPKERDSLIDRMKKEPPGSKVRVGQRTDDCGEAPTAK